MTVNLLITRTSFVTVPGTTTVTKTSSFIREVTDVTEPFDGKFYFVQILTSEFKFSLYFTEILESYSETTTTKLEDVPVSSPEPMELLSSIESVPRN